MLLLVRILAVLGALLALVASGCGGGEGNDGGKAKTGATASTAATAATAKARYRADITRILNQSALAARMFQRSLKPASTPRQAAVALAAFQLKVRRAALALDELRPPDVVASPHRQLARSLRELAAATQPSIDAARSGNRRGLTRALQKLRSELAGPLGRRVRTAAARIDAGLAGSG